MTCELVARDLDAYLDRELDAESSAAVRDHVTSCAVCRRKVARHDTLSSLVRSAPYFTAPDRLRQRVLPRPASRAVRRVVPWAAAAALVLSAGLVGMTQWWSSPPAGDAIVGEAVDNHVRSLQANHLFDVESTDLHTVKPWFSGKLDFSPPVVDIASGGFPLVGGRLDYAGGRAVAALVYQRHTHMINVFVSPQAGNESTRVAALSRRGFNLRGWASGGMLFWAVSDLNGEELDEFVGALRAGLQGTPLSPAVQ